MQSQILFRRVLICFGAACLPLSSAALAQRPQPAGAATEPAPIVEEQTSKVYSGPQVGESLDAVPVWQMTGPDQPTSKVDLAELSRKSPLIVAFMHERSRPAFMLTRVLSRFARQRKDQQLQFYVVVLTEDRSSSEKWLGQVGRYFDEPTRLAVADGGLEGPGSLGLNRLVDMTILVAHKGKVTANFALTQVTAAADAPPVLEAMSQVSGGGEVPTVQELMPQPINANVQRSP